jgi:hypothetical protein
VPQRPRRLFFRLVGSDSPVAEGGIQRQHQSWSGRPIRTPPLRHDCQPPGAGAAAAPPSSYAYSRRSESAERDQSPVNTTASACIFPMTVVS